MKRTNHRLAGLAGTAGAERGSPPRRGNGGEDATGNGRSEAAGPAAGTDAVRIKVGLAEMLKGGVIMDVMNAEQAEIAQEAGAAAVMALERIPSQIRKHGGVARMSDPSMIRRIQAK